MRKLILIPLIIFTAFFFSSPNVSAFDMCDQNCSTCHTLSKSDAKDVLQKLIPDVKVLEVGNGPIKGLWEVGIENNGRKGIIYIDYSKNKVIAGNIIDIATKKNYTRDSFEKINKVDYASIPLTHSIIMGDKNAKYKVVVFVDPV